MTFDEATRLELARLYLDEKCSIQAVADRHNSTYHVVRLTLLDMGVELRPWGRPPRLTRADKAEMLRLHTQQGWKAREIGNQYGVTRDYVYEILRKESRNSSDERC